MDASPQRKPCDGRKVKHGSLERATRHAAGVAYYNALKGRKTRPGIRLIAYWCSTCNAFHVGHEPIPSEETGS
jgi:hypothetical protein